MKSRETTKLVVNAHVPCQGEDGHCGATNSRLRAGMLKAGEELVWERGIFSVRARRGGRRVRELTKLTTARGSVDPGPPACSRTSDVAPRQGCAGRHR